MVKESAGQAAIYARISDDREGEERGVERQIEDCRAKAAALGLTVVEPPFVDNDISASTRSTKKRPAYDDMLARARMGEFSHIVAYSNSRLTRRLRETLDLIDLSNDHGVVIKTVVSGDFDLSKADGKAVAITLATWDQAEAERVGERVKRAVDQRKKLGEYHGSYAPFGYRLVKKVDRAKVGADLLKDDREVALIREAVTRLLDANDSLYSIVRDWNASGKVSRTGKPWRQGVLRRALSNPALVARTRPIVENQRRAPIAAKGHPARWEPILDDATYDALVHRLVDPSRAVANPTGKKSSKYALAGGLTVCGRCGKALYAQKGRSLALKLICKVSANHDDENHPVDPVTGYSGGRVSVAYDLLEDYVFRQYVARLNDSEYWHAHKHDADPDASEKIAEAERQRDAENAKIRRAEDQAFDGLIETDRLRELIDAARDRVRELDAQIADLKGKPSPRDTVVAAFGTPEWILSQWKVFPADAKRTLLKFLIDKIVIKDYPKDLQKTASVRGGESPEDFKARREALWEEGLRRRVVIEWRE